MDNYITLEILRQNKNSQEFADFIMNFRKNRIILDEEVVAINVITSPLMEKWNDECTKFIIENGYDNESAVILCAASFRDNYGAVYALYDLDFIEYSDAKEYIEKYIDAQLSNNTFDI